MCACDCSQCCITSSRAIVVIAMSMKEPLQQLTLGSLAHSLHTELNNEHQVVYCLL